jgi:hypothetical protein
MLGRSEKVFFVKRTASVLLCAGVPGSPRYDRGPPLRPSSSYQFVGEARQGGVPVAGGLFLSVFDVALPRER